PQLESTSDLCELFLNSFGTTLVDPSEIDWIDTGGTFAGTSANGGAVNVGERSITITGNSSGQNAYLEKTFFLSNLVNLEVVEANQNHLRLTKTVYAINKNSTVVITMTTAGVNVDIEGYSFLPYSTSGKIFVVYIPY